MMGCFYNKKALNDALVITINDHKINNIVNNELYSIMYDENNQITAINIFNFSKIFPLAKEGFIQPTNDLIDFIKSYTSCNLDNVDLNNKFIVGVIKNCIDIPNTHLHKCIVNIGSMDLNIICGATNCRTNLKVVCATMGTIMPNGKIIKKSSLLGNESYGMLCSKHELNLSSNKFNDSGIIELDDSYIVGAPFNEVFSI